MAKTNQNASKNAKASARVKAAQQQKKQRMQWSVGIAVLVVVGIVVLVLAKSSTSSSKDKVSTSAKPAPASIKTDLASISLPAIAAATKASPSSNPVQPTEGKKRVVDGKPEVLYIGAEFCPYCAGERWALVAALSKFGTFSDLQMIHSSESNVPTLSFEGSKFTSDYVAFRPVELQDQNNQPLDKATDAELELFQRLGGGAFPFIDFGGTSFQKGGSVDVQLLIGKSQTDIASQLAKSTAKDTSATSLQGNVNSVTGGFIKTICGLTDNQPAKVCKAIPAA